MRAARRSRDRLRRRDVAPACVAAALARWLDKSEVRAILHRRDRMPQRIDTLVKEKGEAAVFIQ